MALTLKQAFAHFWAQIGAQFVRKEDNKGLSTNDYTTAEKTKLSGIAANAEVNQNAFGSIQTKSGSVNATINADAKVDTFTLEAGDNITLITNESTGVIKIVGADAPEAPEASLEALGISATAEELNRVAGVTSNIQIQLDDKVSTTRKINNKPLTSDVSLTYSDVGAAPTQHQHNASDINAGTLAAARLPNISIDKLIAGTTNKTIPSSLLPSYVDDVLEYATKANFPATGETGKIYVDVATNKTYRWSGSAYTEISASLALGETSSTAYYGDKGAAAYTHAVTNKGVAKTNGLYKITTNSEGHVTAGTAVTKSDITALGIPAQDTTYSAATTTAAGLMSAADKTKLDAALINRGVLNQIDIAYFDSLEILPGFYEVNGLTFDSKTHFGSFIQYPVTTNYEYHTQMLIISTGSDAPTEIWTRRYQTSASTWSPWTHVNKVDSQVVEPASGANYYVLGTSTSANGPITTVKNNGFRVKFRQGTDAQEGQSILMLGNGTAVGTNGNKTGGLYIFNKHGRAHTIAPSDKNSDADAYHTLPMKTGTLINSSTYTDFALDINGGNYMLEDLKLLTENNDRFIEWTYSPDSHGFSWRIGELGTGSGDANYFVIQSSGSAASSTDTTWYNALTIGLDTRKVSFKGGIEALNFDNSTPVATFGGAANTSLEVAPTGGLVCRLDSTLSASTSTGGWARGVTYKTANDTTLTSMGVFGSGPKANYMWLHGTYDTPVVKLYDINTAATTSTGSMVVTGGILTNSNIVADCLSLTNSNAINHIYISREGGPGYITGAQALALAIGSPSTATTSLYVATDKVTPGANSTRSNQVSLGVSGNVWKEVHATNFYGAFNGNATTATTADKANGVKVTNEGFSAETICYPLLSTSTGGNNITPRTTSTAHFRILSGTAETEGRAELRLGNGVATGTAGNSRGRIQIYGPNAGYTRIVCGINDDTSNYLYLPGVTGQVVVHTNDTAIGGTYKPVYIADSGMATVVTDNKVLVNLGSTATASIFAEAPRPGVTGTLPVANGGTGLTALVTPTVTWTAGAANGPTLAIKDSLGKTSTAVAIPVASTTASGVLTTGTQQIRGKKILEYPGIASNNTRYQGFSYNLPDVTRVGEHFFDTGSATKMTQGTFTWRQQSYDSSTGAVLTFHENFQLPSVDADRTGSIYYSILTSKNAVTVAQGGTGNTTMTANRMVWSESATKLTAANHYVDATHLAVNSTSAPDDNFRVYGSSSFGDWTNGTRLRIEKPGTIAYCLNEGTSASSSTNAWARGIKYLTADGTTISSFGVYGSGPVINHLWLGNTYNSPWVKLAPVSGNAAQTTMNVNGKLYAADNIYGKNFTNNSAVSATLSLTSTSTLYIQSATTTSGSILFKVGETEVARCNTNGNFVIGGASTTESLYKLYVTGNSHFNGNVSFSDPAQAREAMLIKVSATQPSSPTTGTIWFDIS